ncbi:LLM class flavin-dependent oxidoreductase [Paenibacillus periandrae]|uniref:LLM class flavin-dependent oxidoreductase n=1 Tax=Paenibacillus periandrae TaxID=1761741 RepID=UPI001F095029|nr:LLM class flavin-dependent oxidoreductase [Paenibacillus periandrae]
MKFGIYVEMQNPKSNWKPHAQVYREVLEQIEHADKRGFSTFSTLEHHWFEEFSISANPLALYSAAAQRTDSIRFRTCSHVLPIHNPMVFAGQLAVADILTEGRIEVAFGRGHSWVFPKASIPLEESRGRFMESLEILKLAWSQDSFSYDGQYYKVKNVSIVPKPQQLPHPKIYTGGASNHNYELAGKEGWGVLITPMLPLSKVSHQLDIYREACANYGNKPDIVYVQAIYLDEDEQRAYDEAKPFIHQFMAGNASPAKDMPSRDEMLAKDFAFYASGHLEALVDIPYDTLIDEDYVWVGTPETIKAKVQAIVDECPGLTEISLLCTYAGMEHWRTIRTQQLFSERIMPFIYDNTTVSTI